MLPHAARSGASATSPTWTGFYAGVNAGLRTNQFEIQVDRLPYKFGLINDRGMAGVQAGYNWQFWPYWLVGLEAEAIHNVVIGFALALWVAQSSEQPD